MPAKRSRPIASEDLAELERALTRAAYLLTRNRHHDKIKAAAGVPLDRAAAIVLVQLADSEVLRIGELAAQLDVEAPHITRQVQLLEREGYVKRVADPQDRRAQLVQVTASGRKAADRIREVGRTLMQEALADWTSAEIHELAGLFHRMLDDFLAHDEPENEKEVTRLR